MKVRLICEGFADGHACSVTGQYLKWYDAEAFAGQGDSLWTDKVEDAIVFESPKAALACWQQVPRRRPYRKDGELNRPLMAFNISIETIPEDGDQGEGT